jgi:hypothetical protein
LLLKAVADTRCWQQMQAAGQRRLHRPAACTAQGQAARPLQGAATARRAGRAALRASRAPAACGGVRTPCNQCTRVQLGSMQGLLHVRRRCSAQPWDSVVRSQPSWNWMDALTASWGLQSSVREHYLVAAAPTTGGDNAPPAPSTIEHALALGLFPAAKGCA